MDRPMLGDVIDDMVAGEGGQHLSRTDAGRRHAKKASWRRRNPTDPCGTNRWESSSGSKERERRSMESACSLQ